MARRKPRNHRRYRGWRYPTLAFVLDANAGVLGNPKAAVRDEGLIDSAVQAPVASAGGEDAYPTHFLKVAALGWAIANNHGFVDGNKRTAYLIMRLVLDWNGYYLGWSTETVITVMTLTAAGHLDREGLSFALALGCGLDPASTSIP